MITTNGIAKFRSRTAFISSRESAAESGARISQRTKNKWPFSSLFLKGGASTAVDTNLLQKINTTSSAPAAPTATPSNTVPLKSDAGKK